MGRRLRSRHDPPNVPRVAPEPPPDLVTYAIRDDAARRIVLAAVGDVGHTVRDERARVHRGVMWFAESEIETRVEVERLVMEALCAIARVEHEQLTRRQRDVEQIVGP